MPPRSAPRRCPPGELGHACPSPRLLHDVPSRSTRRERRREPLRPRPLGLALLLQSERPDLLGRCAPSPQGSAPRKWLLTSETQAVVSHAIEALPLAYHEVILPLTHRGLVGRG